MSRRDMRLANVLLAGATLALGAVAVYCARGLEQQRLRVRPLSAVAAEPAVAPEEAAAITSIGPPDPVAGVFAAVAAVADNGRDAGDLAVARYRLSRFADPHGRADEAARLADTRREWEELGKIAGLSAEEAGSLAAHAVEAQLQDLRKVHACLADPACERPAYPVAQTIAEEQLLRMFGPEKVARIQAHQAASGEHQFVRMFRDLPAVAALGDADAGGLALALAEERQRFEQAAAQSGAMVETQDGPYVGYHLRIATAPAESHDLQRKLESATQYNAGLYERAAAILPPAPLARFKAIQDAALEAYRRKVEEMEVARTARRAAGLP